MRGAFMSAEYKAFISYCRQPEDSNVAAEICRLLENYPVAHEIKSQGKQMGKIYCDDAKPRISSELSDDTRAALENSEYLIAVFSEKAKESDKISNEIEYFLKSHTADKILPVIIDGEIEEVIPENIMAENKVLCDWRVVREKAVGRELRKIAVVLLGCSPKKRKRNNRKVKKYLSLFVAGIIFLALLAAVVYLIVSLVQGKPNTAKVNLRSEYLASQSMKAYDNGEIEKAAALALEAAGAGNTQSSCSPSAELALSKAVAPYASENGKYSQVASFSSGEGAGIEDFQLSEDEKYLYTIDHRCDLSIFEVESKKKLASVHINTRSYNDIESLAVLPDHSVLVRYNWNILCRFGLDGKEKWRMEDVIANSVWKSKDKLLVVTNDDVERLCIVDYGSGKTEKTYQFPDMGFPISLFPEKLINDENILITSKETPGLGEHSYYVCHLFNIRTGKCNTVYQCNYRILSPVVTDDGKLILMMNHESVDGDYEKVIDDLTIREDMIIAPKKDYHIVCVDVNTGDVLWDHSFETFISNDYGMTLTPNKKRILCYQGNTFCLLDVRTGKEIAECETESAIVSIQTDNKQASGFTEDGSCFEYYYDSEDVYDEYSGMHINDGVVWKKLEYTGNLYALDSFGRAVIRFTESDKQSQAVIEGKDYSDLEFIGVNKGRLYLRDEENCFSFNLSTKELSTIDSDLESFADSIGTSSDGRLWMLDGTGDDLSVYEYDFDEEKSSELMMNLSEDGVGGYDGLEYGGCILFKDHLIYLSSDPFDSDCGVDIVSCDLQSENVVYRPVKGMGEQASGEDDSFYDDYKLLAYAENFAYISMEDTAGSKILLEVEVNTGKAKMIMQGKTDEDFDLVADSDNDRYALSDNGKVKLGAAGSDESIELTVENGAKLYYPSFVNGELLVFGDDGCLYRFSEEDGSLLGKTVLLDLPSSCWDCWDYSDTKPEILRTAYGYIVVNVYGTANVIETKTWKVVGTVADFVAYDDTTDSFICERNGDFVLYYRLNRNQLIEKAKELAGDYNLTESDMAV